MKRRSVVCLINIGLGLFVAYMFLLYIRERNISTTQYNIACNIVNIDMRHSSRQHPIVEVIYRNRKYTTNITNGERLQIGYNTTTFYYDELLDRVFCRNSGIERGLYVAILLFVWSFLFWSNSNITVNKERNKFWLCSKLDVRNEK